MEVDGFVLNTRRKGRKGFRKASQQYIPEDRTHVTEKDVSDAVIFGRSKVNEFFAHIASTVSKHLPNNAKVIQLQLYGMGAIDSRFTSGCYQMAVAFDLLTHYRIDYPACSATFQEPIIAPGEVIYLQNHGIIVLNDSNFSASTFHKAETDFIDENGIPENAAMICYMIHGHWTMLDAFLAAHWTPSQLSRIIIIGNSLKNVATAQLLTEIPNRVLAYAKLCNETSIDTFLKDQIGLHFTQTAVISISFNNATNLIDNFKIL